jgi:hypothetical protein
LSDQPRERLFNLPGVILWLILAMGALHFFREHFLTNEEDVALLAAFSFVPARLTAQFDAAGVAAVLRTIALRGGNDIEIATYFLSDGSFQPWTALTYSVLHADWMHFGLNAIWFAAFGAPVARRFGAARFIALFVVTALAGTLSHWLFHAYDATPMIGASAAVSGAMGAALRFVFQPGAPLGLALALRPDEPLAYRLRALPLRHVMRDQRVLTFIIFWFLSNLIFGVGAQPLGLSDGGIAWQAHVGGFLAGLLLFSVFDPKGSDSHFEFR